MCFDHEMRPKVREGRNGDCGVRERKKAGVGRQDLGARSAGCRKMDFGKAD